MSMLSGAAQIEALIENVMSLATSLRGRYALIERGNGFSGGVAGVLKSLGIEGALTVPEIARERRTSRQNVQVVVNRLKETGLVELESNPAHKRSALVRLTERGKSAFSQIQQMKNLRLEGLVTQLSEADLVAAGRVLNQIRQLLAGQAGLEPGPGQADLVRSFAAKQARVTHHRRHPQPVLAEESQSDAEEFPLSLL